MWNMERIRLTASEEMSFVNVDGRTMDGRRMPVYTISSPGELTRKKNTGKVFFDEESIYKISKP